MSRYFAFSFLSLSNFYFLSPHIMYWLIPLLRIPSCILDFPSRLIFFSWNISFRVSVKDSLYMRNTCRFYFSEIVLILPLFLKVSCIGYEILGWRLLCLHVLRSVFWYLLMCLEVNHQYNCSFFPLLPLSISSLFSVL